MLSNDENSFIHYLADSLSCFGRIYLESWAQTIPSRISHTHLIKRKTAKANHRLFQLLITNVHIHYRLETVFLKYKPWEEMLFAFTSISEQVQHL